MKPISAIYLTLLFSICTRTNAFVVRSIASSSSLSSSLLHPTISSKLLAVPTDSLSYSIASHNLSQSWIQLVQEGKVTTTIDMDGETVQYGVTWKDNRCQEFVEGTSVRIQEIQKALELSKDISQLPITRKSDEDGYIAQLPLLRTLRPPPSPGFSTTATTSSIPPTYDERTDSFVTGPLRLQLRPLVGTLSLPQLTTPWQVFHNVSPADIRGHFLLIPTLEDPTKNWRSQSLTESDCYDLVHLAASIYPIGSLFIGFNSVGAAASQNHIHAHIWPTNNYDYAVCNVKGIFDYMDVHKDDDGLVEVSWLEYPVFCIELSSSNRDALADVVATVLRCIGDAPYNVGFMNRQEEEEEEEEDDDDDENNNNNNPNKPTIFTDVYIFVRSKERSQIIPELKLGISEMMGVFHAQSQSELELLGTGNTMSQALSDVTYYDENTLWNQIQHVLSSDHSIIP